MELLRNFQLGSELWVAAMGNVFRVVWACLGSPEVRERKDVRLLRRLGVCLLKAVDVAYDLYDADCSFSLPVGVIWTIFYTLIARSEVVAMGRGLLLRAGLLNLVIGTWRKKNTKWQWMMM